MLGRACEQSVSAMCALAAVDAGCGADRHTCGRADCFLFEAASCAIGPHRDAQVVRRSSGDRLGWPAGRRRSDFGRRLCRRSDFRRHRLVLPPSYPPLPPTPTPFPLPAAWSSCARRSTCACGPTPSRPSSASATAWCPLLPGRAGGRGGAGRGRCGHASRCARERAARGADGGSAGPRELRIPREGLGLGRAGALARPRLAWRCRGQHSPGQLWARVSEHPARMLLRNAEECRSGRGESCFLSVAGAAVCGRGAGAARGTRAMRRRRRSRRRCRRRQAFATHKFFQESGFQVRFRPGTASARDGAVVPVACCSSLISILLA